MNGSIRRLALAVLLLFILVGLLLPGAKTQAQEE